MVSAEEILEFLRKNPKYIDTLKLAIEHEEKNKSKDVYLGWEWSDVRQYPISIRKLVVAGIVKINYSSSNYTHYLLEDREATKRALKMFEMLSEEPGEAPPKPGEGEIPGDLFSVIIGFDSIKEIFFKSLRAETPVHILLIAPPATAAKSLWMMELERLPGAVYVSFGGGVTQTGLRDIIATTPRYLILDELDKVQNSADLSALLTWMESGRVTIVKYKTYKDIRGKGWFFAAANSTRGLSPEMLSRFMVFNIPPYTREEYMEVSRRVLVDREGLDGELAEYIARRTTEEGFSDVRDAVRIARLVKNSEKPRDETERIIRTHLRYR